MANHSLKFSLHPLGIILLSSITMLSCSKKHDPIEVLTSATNEYLLRSDNQADEVNLRQLIAKHGLKITSDSISESNAGTLELACDKGNYDITLIYNATKGSDQGYLLGCIIHLNGEYLEQDVRKTGDFISKKMNIYFNTRYFHEFEKKGLILERPVGYLSKRGNYVIANSCSVIGGLHGEPNRINIHLVFPGVDLSKLLK